MASRKQKKTNGEATTATTVAAAPEQKAEKKTASAAAVPKKAAKKKVAKKAPKKPATRRTTAKRRGPGRPKGSKNKTRVAAKTRGTGGPRKGVAPKRYTPSERAKILAAAKREGLSGLAAAKKFGISSLTFYNWRKQAGMEPRGGWRRGRTTVSSALPRDFDGQLGDLVRREVRARLSQALPHIVQEEVAIALGGRAGPRGRRR